jgi:hypothetical protein
MDALQGGVLSEGGEDVLENVALEVRRRAGMPAKQWWWGKWNPNAHATRRHAHPKTLPLRA